MNSSCTDLSHIRPRESLAPLSRYLKCVFLILLLSGLTTSTFAAVLFSDNFEDGTLNKWTVVSGSWNVITEGTGHVAHLAAGSTQNRRMVSVASVSGSTIILSAKTRGNSTIDSHADCTIGFYANGSASSYYFVMLGGTTSPDFWIGRWNGGSVELLTRQTIEAEPNNVWYNVKVKLEGSRIDVKVWQDGSTEPTQWQLFLANVIPYGDHLVLGSAHGTDNEEFWFDSVVATDTDASQPYRFVHITDTHVGILGGQVRFLQMISFINSLSPRPAFVVISGDLVNAGASGLGQVNYGTFDIAAAALSMDHYTCPGNHDSRPLFNFLNYQLLVNWNLYWSQPVQSVRLISLTSGADCSVLDCGPWWWPAILKVDWTPEADGLDPDQYNWLQSELRAYPGVPKIVFLHHPIVNGGSSCSEEEYGNGCITRFRDGVFDLLRDEDPDLNSGDDAVKLVLSGHLHSGFVRRSVSPNQESNLSGWVNHQANPLSTADYSQNLPLHVNTDAAIDLVYRLIDVNGDNVVVWPQQTVGETIKAVARWSGTSGPKKARIGSDLVYDPAGRMHVYDSLGHHIGFNDADSADFEIDSAYYMQESVFDSAGNEYVYGEVVSLMFGTQNYHLQFQPAQACTLYLSGELFHESGGSTRFVYPPIAAGSGQLGELSVTYNEVDYPVRWDDDGDGLPDRIIAPDSVYCPDCEDVCGDANGSGLVNISDVVYLINYIFSGGPAPSPVLAGDANCSGGVNISDAVYLINYIFGGGAAPCAACK